MPRAIGARLGLTAEAVETLENRSPGFGERLLAGLAQAAPDVAAPTAVAGDDLLEAYRREVRRLMLDAAAAGNVVILGRYGNAVLQGRLDLMRVFLYAPLAWRIANVQASLDCTAEAARSEIARIDAAGRRLGHELYRTSWGDLRQYDLTLDCSRCGVAASAEIIAVAVRAGESGR